MKLPNRITTTLEAPPGEYQRSLYLSLLWRKLVTMMSACSGRNYNFWCINVCFFKCFCASRRQLRLKTELTLAVTDGPVANHWTDRGKIWHTYADSSGNGNRLKKINISSPTGYLEGVRGSHIQTCRKDTKYLDWSGPNLAHVCIFIWEWTSAKKK